MPSTPSAYSQGVRQTGIPSTNAFPYQAGRPGPAARARDVRRRRRGAASSAGAAAQRRGSGHADLRRPVLLRADHADPDAGRHALVRHPAARHDGRHLPGRPRPWPRPSWPAGAQLLFGSIIGAGVVSILIAPAVSRMLCFFPPVVTGTIIAVIGITLMRVGWIFGNPVGPTAPAIVDPAYAKWRPTDARRPGAALPQVSPSSPRCPTRSTPTRSAWASRPWCCCPSCSSSSTRAASSPISRCCWASWSAPSPPRPAS